MQEALELERKILTVVEKNLPTTVGLRLRNGQGSGVIVSPDGIVLTAAHVIGPANMPIQFVMPDGTTYSGRSLGRVRSLDAGMAVIDDAEAPDALPFASLGTSDDLVLGTWAIAMGHPGGYEEGRPPVVRVGRLNRIEADLLQSDNTLVGGDSGGPLFDLDGRVIGIHSRIGEETLGGNILAGNVHVPVDRFVDEWQTMATGRDAGSFELPEWMQRQVADDGVRLDLGTRRDSNIDDGTPRGAGEGIGDDGRVGATVRMVLPGSAAAEAGLAAGDRILGVGDRVINSETDFLNYRLSMPADQTVAYRIADVDGGQRTIAVTPVGLSGRPANGLVPRDRSYQGVLGITMNGPPESRDAAVIDSVVAESPAARVGIRSGDRVISIRGIRVYDFSQVNQALSNSRAGDLISLKVQSPDGPVRSIRVELAARSDIHGGRE